MQNDTTLVPIGGPKYAGLFMKIDSSDLPVLERRPISVGSHGYPCINKKKRSYLVHRLIMEAQKGEVVDHINSDRLDNRRKNLRICTTAQNARNVSKQSARLYKGVYWAKLRGCYEVSLEVDSKKVYLGAFTDPLFGAEVYDATCAEYHGIFARPNFKGDITDRAAAYLKEWNGPRYRAISPAGEVFEIQSMRKFCAEYGLNQSGMSSVALGKQKGLKGWHCERISILPTRPKVA